MANVTPKAPPLEIDIRPAARSKPAPAQTDKRDGFDRHLDSAADAARRGDGPSDRNRADGARAPDPASGPRTARGAETGPADAHPSPVTGTNTSTTPDSLSSGPEAESVQGLPGERARGDDAGGADKPLRAPSETAAATVAEADLVLPGIVLGAAQQTDADGQPIAFDEVTGVAPAAPAPIAIPDSNIGDQPMGFTETPAEELPEVEPADAPLPNPSRGPDPITVERMLAQQPALPPQAANGFETAQANRPEHYSGLGRVTALTPDTVPLEPMDAVQSDAEAATPEAAGDNIAGVPLTPALPETGLETTDTITPAVAAPADPAAAPSVPPLAGRPVIAPPTGVAQTVDGIPAAPVPPTAGLSVPPAPIDTVTAPPADPTLQARPSGAAPQTAPPTDQTQPGAIRTDPALSADADAPAPHASAAPKPASRALDSSAGSKPDPGANPPGAPGAERNAPRPALTTAFDTMAAGSQAQGTNKPGPSAAPPATPPGIALDLMSPAAAGSAAPASDPATAALPLAQNSHTISVRFGASPVPGPSAQMPVNTLAFNIARNFDNGVNRFEIRIDPPELGRVDVKLDMSVEGRVQAHLTVERSETLELMMRDARSLEKALADTGLNMSRDSLSFSLKDQNASGGGRGADNGGNEATDGGDLPGDDDPATETARGYITDSGVDITV